MAESVYKITELFEQEISNYTGAPHVITVDNASNAIFLALMYEQIKDKIITIPSHTYPSVPCEIIHAGGKVALEASEPVLRGAYNLKGTKVWDSALRFTADMYIANTHMCVSFTGPYKTLKLSKGGAILTDDYKAALWFKRARYSGRRECSYFDDNFDMLGWNFYMMPELAARGLLLFKQFYNAVDNTKKHIPDIEMRYPDLSKYSIYTKY